MEKLKITIRRVLIVLLAIWMVGVFMLSHQTGEGSSNLSRLVSNFLAGGDVVKAEEMEPIVRKVAHITEYAVGGMLCYGITLTFPITMKKRLIYTALFVVIYASSDEIHQLFIDKRHGSVWDVMIDTIGGALGVGTIFIIENSIRMIDTKVQEDLKNQKIGK